ncbi:transporter [Cupriavidus sp. SK-3]|uniref:TolC family protein n=1 Tax=Cupriavidus sp. SK-3 TaxID=1470558 RepID=UPI0004512378|nr:TolC family protein [Cupriavidus sp. SK-3]KDP87245.1 transporter [Cupriavidus sp. SK-3]
MNLPTNARVLLAAALLLLARCVVAEELGGGPTLPLREAIAEALGSNPDIRAARQEYEAAQQRIAPAGALDDPMLEAGVVNLPVSSLSFNRDDMTMKMVGLSQRFPYPGKRALRRDLATKEAESTLHGVQETVNRVTRDVKVAYFDLALAIESMRLTENNKRALEQFLKTAEARYAVGQSSQADVLKAQTQVAKMTDELIKLGRERRMIEAELNRALGRAPDLAAPVPHFPTLKEFAPRLDELRHIALASRPQLLALQSTIARSEKALQVARREYYPDFDVRFSYGQRDRSPMGGRREDMVSLTVAINLPLWRESKLGPRVAEATAMRDQTTSMLQAQQNEVSSRLRQEAANAEQTFKSARLYETTVLPQARLTVESSLAAYRVNRVDFFTLLDNQMTVLNYEIGYATAVVNQNKARAELEFLTGVEIY